MFFIRNNAFISYKYKSEKGLSATVGIELYDLLFNPKQAAEARIGPQIPAIIEVSPPPGGEVKSVQWIDP